MSRERYSYAAHGRGERWDTERFEIERDRDRHGTDVREHFEERETRYSSGGGHSGGRPRERSIDEVYERERIGPRGGYEEDRYERREYIDDEPRHARERPRSQQRMQNVTIEERERYYSPPRAGPPPARPEFMRRRSSLESFDRRHLTKFVEREEYGPAPSSYSDEPRPPPLNPIRARGPPPRRYEEREYEEIAVAEPDYYGDEEFRGYPERVREREIIRRRRRSGSRGSATSSRSESVFSEVIKSEFPKKGKTRMPARLVSKRAIIDLGYTFEEEGNVVIIQKALGRENIDEVIKLSEDYKKSGKNEVRSEPEVVIRETTHEIITAPAVPHIVQPSLEVVSDTKIVETRSVSPSPHHHHHSSHHNNPIIIEAGRPREEYSDAIAVGPLALVSSHSHSRHSSREDRVVRAEIALLEAEKAKRYAEKDYRRIRHSGRSSETELVLYDRDSYGGPSEEITLVRREREPDIGVRIEKDKKGPPPKLVRAMLKTLT